jgi:two-component system, cell cycle sensor histidine kinase and response regulator CckA
VPFWAQIEESVAAPPPGGGIVERMGSHGRDRGEFFDLAVDLLASSSFKGELLDVNAAWEQILGYPIDALCGSSVRALIHPEDWESCVAQATRLRYGAGSASNEIRMIAADGSIRWMIWNAVASADRRTMFGIGRDVTRERVLYDVARAIPMLTTPEQVAERMLSEATILVPASWTSIALFGEPEAEVVAYEVSGPLGGPRSRLRMRADQYGDVEALAEGRVQHYIDLSPDDDIAEFVAGKVEEGMRSSLKVPLAFREEVLGCLHFGSEDAGAFGQQQIKDALEVAKQLAIALKQIRLRREVESSEAGFRSIAANADGLVIVGHKGVVRFANRAAEELFGVARGELEGRDFGHEISAGERREIPVRPDQDKSHIAEMRVVRTAWEGEPALLASLRDVSEQRRLEANLLQAQKMSVVGRLAGAVAHDFNNLLTAMTGHVDRLHRALGDDHPSADSVAALSEAVDRATRVAQQVLTFSRKQVVTPRPMDLAARVERLEPLLAQVCGEDIQLHFDLSRPAAVHADPIQLEQVLMNLVVNARDAMDGEGIVEVRTGLKVVDEDDPLAEEGLAPGIWVVLGVRDAGGGMSSDTLERIFEPFFTTKDEGKGLGLGLSTAYDIVRKSGGEIRVKTAPGKGALFQVWLPACEDEPIFEETSQAIEPLPGGQERILVVDDEPALRRLLDDCLSEAGYRVTVAGDAREALSLVPALGKIDLLLTDVRMPGMHGRDLEAHVRERLPNLKSIFMSGYSEEILGPSGVLEEGVEFIAKPFRLGHLLRRVRRVLDRDDL